MLFSRCRESSKTGEGKLYLWTINVELNSVVHCSTAHSREDVWWRHGSESFVNVRQQENDYDQLWRPSKVFTGKHIRLDFYTMEKTLCNAQENQDCPKEVVPVMSYNIRALCLLTNFNVKIQCDQLNPQSHRNHTQGRTERHNIDGWQFGRPSLWDWRGTKVGKPVPERHLFIDSFSITTDR